MQELDYSAFKKKVSRAAVARRLPRVGQIEVTHRCPLNCRHCFNRRALGDLQARAQEMTTAEHCRIVDKIAEAGCFWLCYTGGEPFARPDFPDIYDYAFRKGFLLVLFTNAVLITPEIAEHLGRRRPLRIEVTLYGATAETFDAFTRVPGSFSRCLTGLALLREQRLQLRLKTLATSDTAHEVAAMGEIAKQMGADFAFENLIHARVDGGLNPLAVRLDPGEAVDLSLRDAKRRKVLGDLLALANKAPTLAERKRTIGDGPLYVCPGGQDRFGVDPSGRLAFCVIEPLCTYDLLGGSFQEGWDECIGVARGRKFATESPCRLCALRPKCGCCPAIARPEMGDDEAPVPYFCHFSHLSVMALGGKVPSHGDCPYCEGGDAYDILLEEARDLAEVASGPQTLLRV